MKTRIVALFLSLAMLLSLCSFAIAEEPTQLTICIGRRPYDSTESYSEKHWVQEVEKACNLKINWIELPEETMKEQLSSVLTNTNNLPDIFMCGNKMTDSIVSQNTGLWHVFTMDEIKQYAPTYYEVCEKYIDGWVDATTYPDGNIYSLMGSVYDSERHYSYGVLYMNYQWLKNLNLEVPTTLDDLHDMLVAFRDQDANGNGDPNDEVGIVTNTLDRYINLFSGAFGIHNRGREDMLVDADPADETKIRFVYTTDEYRALLSFVNRLYEEKLIDQNMLTPSTSNMVALGSQNQIFALAYTNMAAAAVDESKYEPLTLSLTGPGGNAWNTLNKGFGVGNFVISNTVSKEDAITLIKWADTLFTLDGARMLYFGEENVDYTLDENGYPNYVDSILSQVSSDNPYDKVISAITCFASGGIPGYKDDIWNCGSECRGKALEAAQNMEQFANKITWSFNFTIDENDELSALKTDIVNNCHNVYRAKFIEGTLDVDDDAVWNQYLEEIQNAGLEDLIAIYQTALDRMLAK